jgi:hypothetical protein
MISVHGQAQGVRAWVRCPTRLTPVRDNGPELVELCRSFGKGRQLQALEFGGDGVGHGVGSGLLDRCTRACVDNTMGGIEAESCRQMQLWFALMPTLPTMRASCWRSPATATPQSSPLPCILGLVLALAPGHLASLSVAERSQLA